MPAMYGHKTYEVSKLQQRELPDQPGNASSGQGGQVRHIPIQHVKTNPNNLERRPRSISQPLTPDHLKPVIKKGQHLKLTPQNLLQQQLQQQQHHFEQVHLYHFRQSRSSSGGSSPTKSPSTEYSQKYAFQVTQNKTYNEEEDSPPPTLPPRNYRNDRMEYKFRPLPSPVGGYQNDLTTEFENTPKPDYYAHQLRQQMLKYGAQKGVRLQSKPLGELKPTVAMSRPVDQPPILQEAVVPQSPRSSDVVGHDGSNGKMNPPDVVRPREHKIDVIHIKTVENNSNQGLPNQTVHHQQHQQQQQSHQQKTQQKQQPIHAHYPHDQSVSHHYSHQRSTGAETSIVSPRVEGDVVDDGTPPPPPAVPPPACLEVTLQEDILPDHLPSSQSHPLDGALLKSLADDENTPNRYSDESYMTKRHTTRQGFNGNYRRSNSNEIIKTTSPVLVTSTGQSILEPRVAQPLRKHLSESPVSSANPPKASETLVTLPSVVSDSGKPSSESKTHLEKGPVVHKPQQQQQPPPVPPKTFTSSTDRLADISPKDNVEKRASPQQQIRLSPTTSKVTNLDEASRQLAFLNNFNNTQDIAPSLTPKSESSDKVTTTKTSSTFSHSKIVSVRRSSETLNGLHNVNGDSHSSSPDTSLTRSNLTQNSPPRTPPTTSNSFNSPNSSSSFSSPSSLSTPRANEEISKKEENNDEEKEKSEAKGETSPTSLSPVHVRQKSMEEIACEKAAAVVAIQIVEQDKELSDVILPPPDHKMTTDYMTGLFDTNVVAISPSSSFVVSPRSREDNKENRRSSGTLSSSTENLSPYWSPPTVASLQSKIRDEGLKKEEILREMGVANTSLQRQKEELEQRIVQKLAILRSEKEALKEEQLDNDHLGKQVTSVVEKKVQNKGEFDKYKLYIDELEKVMYLLLKLSGRLARAENAFMSLPPDADDKEKNQLIVKRDEASEKHTDAKLLKRGIDRRCQQVSGFLSKYLTKEEYEHFNYFVKMKAKLTMDQQELEDKIKLGEEQLGALRTNMAAGSTKNGKGD